MLSVWINLLELTDTTCHSYAATLTDLYARVDTLRSSRPRELAVRLRAMSSECRRRGRQTRSASWQATVQRAELYVRAHLDTPIHLADLCRVVGLSERGLRNAFYGVHGMSPKRWILTERLMRSQTALRQPGNVAMTVTSVAADHGFYQLGRFAGMYRQRFGETPSETLRAACRTARRTITTDREGDGDACTNR
jgi:transcriptional regulator GlxA family with amidase domain